jgi:DEAD/DEAH box helicase domain-containing protein
MDAFGLERPGPCPVITQRRKLFTHQVTAIESAMRGIHTLVCTGTGSGKSLCFLLPVLTAAINNETSLLLFPTKALAQDQMSKLTAILEKFPDLKETIKPGIIDGDTSHAERNYNAKNCNVILTNPDTLHAAILPGWKATYKTLLGRIKYVVIDEAHMYEGVFGAHVAMVLSRFLRLAAVCSHKAQGCIKSPVFLACSATMAHPEHHFRLLCPILKEADITILAPDDDGSPRAAKHFFVWNPPIMDINGASTGRVTMPRPKKKKADTNDKVVFLPTPPVTNGSKSFRESDELQLAGPSEESVSKDKRGSFQQNGMQLYRRHAADETALLLARAVSQGVRCIAFCKTRCLVEWVYERAVSALKSSPSTEHLADKVESYRGGYTRELRRSIESRLFKNDLLGVVGTNALELGVDVGGIDLTLHCGYPSSYASLLQQAGRAGRGTARLDVPSLSIMVCFNSPSEQHIHRNPKSLLSRGRSALVSMPINVGLVQGHLLCAGEEYPLTGKLPINTLFATEVDQGELRILNDFDLFGSESIFRESTDGLVSTGLMKEATLPVATSKKQITVFKTHPVSAYCSRHTEVYPYFFMAHLFAVRG